jgi:hypothetical protein
MPSWQFTIIVLHVLGPDSGEGGHEDVIMYDPPSITTSMSMPVVGLKSHQNLASVRTSSMTPRQGMSETLISATSMTVISLMANPTDVNTLTAKVYYGRFKYLHFKLPASTFVDLKFTLLFCLK